MNLTSPKLQLPFIAPAQAQKHITHNEALTMLDTIVHLSLISKAMNTPPTEITEGDCYYVANTAGGDWAGQDGNIALWQDGAWLFYILQIGWCAWVEDESLLSVWDGNSWQNVGSVANPDILGVNASADTQNRLSVNSTAVLFNHEGADVRIKLNKNSAPNTASLLFQTGFSGRAEIGLTGNDDFNFKVSVDGNNFHNSIILDKNTGQIKHMKTPRISRRMSSVQTGLGVIQWGSEMCVAEGISYDVSTHRFNVTHKGTYQINICLRPQANTQTHILLGKNTDTPTQALNQNIGQAHSANGESISLSVVVDLEAGDNTTSVLLTGGLYGNAADAYNFMSMVKLA